MPLPKILDDQIKDQPMLVEIQIRENGSRRVLHHCQGPSRTRQEFSDEADINNVMDRYIQTGQFSHVAKALPFYADATLVNDYYSSKEAADRTMEAFMQLPAKARNKFDNDPGKLINFLKNPENEKEAIAMGLLEPQPQPNPPPMQPAAPVAAEPVSAPAPVA